MAENELGGIESLNGKKPPVYVTEMRSILLVKNILGYIGYGLLAGRQLAVLCHFILGYVLHAPSSGMKHTQVPVIKNKKDAPPPFANLIYPAVSASSSSVTRPVAAFSALTAAIGILSGQSRTGGRLECLAVARRQLEVRLELARLLRAHGRDPDLRRVGRTCLATSASGHGVNHPKSLSFFSRALNF